jgi:hypothetical protein
MKQGLVFAMAALLLTGCATKLSHTALVPQRAPLKPEHVFYVAVPEPGRDEERVYEASSIQTAQAFTQAISAHAKTKMGRQPETLEKAINSASAEACDFLILPTIRMWEDNPTEWNGEPDDLKIEVETVDLKTKETVSRVLLSSKSKWATFGDKPEEMLPEIAAPFAKTLFGQ